LSFHDTKILISLLPIRYLKSWMLTRSYAYTMKE